MTLQVQLIQQLMQRYVKAFADGNSRYNKDHHRTAYLKCCRMQISIIVMDDGEINGIGTHEELLAAKMRFTARYMNLRQAEAVILMRKAVISNARTKT